MIVTPNGRIVRIPNMQTSLFLDRHYLDVITTCFHPKNISSTGPQPYLLADRLNCSYYGMASPMIRL